jgi:hypothetical protein
MIQPFLTLDTAFVFAASTGVYLRISQAIQLCTLAVLQGLRPKFVARGAAAAMMKKRINKKLHAKTCLKSSFSALLFRCPLM